MNKIFTRELIVAIVLLNSLIASAGLREKANLFPFVMDNVPAQIFVAEEEHKCVHLAAKNLQDDIQSITDSSLEILSEGLASNAVVMIGTIGTSDWINDIEKKVPEIGKIRSQNEAYVIKVVENISPDIKKALVIVGADRRGTMWGIYTLCQNELGIDPMKLWSELKPKKQKELIVEVSTQTDAPAIPYRGLFINDEWGLLNFQSDGKVFAYKTHEMVVETILRLKGNMYCIPMKGKPLKKADKQLIHDRGILHTASHHEILLAKTLFIDWDEYCMKTYDKKIPYSYIKNKKELGLFFKDAINHHKMYDCIWPVGLRGAGDRAFWKSDPWAPKDMNTRAEIVSEGTAWQLDLLRETTDSLYYESVPKTMTLYNELFELYETGSLTVPEEAITIWTDNSGGAVNFPQEKFTGKQGVYYHITYCKNHNVQYIGPQMILDEFKRILDFGADQYYLVNVGDIKESMLGTEYTMQLAWDGRRTNWNTSIDDFVSYWNSKYFSETVNKEIAVLYQDYFQHTFSRNYDFMASGMYKRAIEIGPKFIKQLKESGVTPSHYSEKLSKLHEAYRKEFKIWEGIFKQSEQIYSKLNDEPQKVFYHQNITYHIQMHRLILQWNVEVMTAIKLYTEGNTEEALKLLVVSEGTLDEITEAVAYAEVGQYKGWYTNRIPNRAPDKWTPIMKPILNDIRVKLIKNMETI